MPAFNVSRAVDLSAFAAAAKAPPPPAGARYVLDVTEANFDATVQLSVKHPVVIELYSPRANAQALSDDLTAIANAAGGKFLLGRVNVDVSGQIAQAFGIQAVPTVLGVVAGQLLPLFQGTKTRAEVEAVLGQLLAAAAQAGVTGIADPVSIDANAAPDPRFGPADEALEAGDYAAAVAEFDKLLAANPADAEAKAGRAQAALLQRVTSVDARATLLQAATTPGDIDAQLAAADIEITGGKKSEAFSRIIAVIRDNTGADKERARVRLLELFETLPASDPDVARARRELMTALF
ncbi:MAG: tetratricopeptide repeat protein [Propionibacteriaceae bacterium]|nr:tetratricopeptide repeat protein [Propionibacteriaceae bacterium]